jgi:hypothetical protein
MPDRTPTEVYAELGALGLRPLDDADLNEIVHRINAVNEAVEELDYPDADVIEPLTIFWLSEESDDEGVSDGR